jgi:ribosomal protein S8
LAIWHSSSIAVSNFNQNFSRLAEQIIAVLEKIGYISSHSPLQKVIKGATGMENQQPKFGFTTFAENWNGRLAMIGFAAALLIEMFSGQGLLHFLGLM